MARKLKGIRRKGAGWEVNKRINGVLYTETFPLETEVADMLAWRERQKDTHATKAPTTAGSFAADVETYLTRVTAMPTYKQRAAHLKLWTDAIGERLGRECPSGRVTATVVDSVMQAWLQTPTVIAPGGRGRPSGPSGLAPETVRKRFKSLQALFVSLKGVPNPTADATPPAALKPSARGLDYGTIARVIAAMPAERSHKPGTPATPSLAKLRVAVLAYTGLPPGLLAAVEADDLTLGGSPSLRVEARKKGAGVEARTIALTPDGVAAFKAFHKAGAYGPYAVQSVNRAFQKACKRVGVRTAVTLYDLRHSFGSELYRVTGDLATVARFLLHAPGSPMTARYALGANQAVDVEAARAFSHTLARTKRAALKATPRPARYRKLEGKLEAARKSRPHRHLRIVS